jgi:hypothetical protein
MPAAMIAIFLKSAIVFLVCLAIGDVAGVVGISILDIPSLRGWSVALPYVVWLVIGVFTGTSALAMAGTWIAGKDGEWETGSKANSIAFGFLLSSLAVATALAVFFWKIYWSQGMAASYYVPDSQSHSITYLVGIFGGMVVVWLVSKPSSKA